VHPVANWTARCLAGVLIQASMMAATVPNEKARQDGANKARRSPLIAAATDVVRGLAGVGAAHARRWAGRDRLGIDRRVGAARMRARGRPVFGHAALNFAAGEHFFLSRIEKFVTAVGLKVLGLGFDHDCLRYAANQRRSAGACSAFSRRWSLWAARHRSGHDHGQGRQVDRALDHRCLFRGTAKVRF
jgi:hypothetical protein